MLFGIDKRGSRQGRWRISLKSRTEMNLHVLYLTLSLPMSMRNLLEPMLATQPCIQYILIDVMAFGRASVTVVVPDLNRNCQLNPPLHQERKASET